MEITEKYLEKVMLVETFRNSVMFRFGCDCCNETCDIALDFEFDKEHKLIWVSLYKKLEFCDYYGLNDSIEDKFFTRCKNFLKRWKKRFLGAFKLFFTGYIEVEGEMIIMGEKQINNLIEVLKDGRDYCLKKMTESDVKERHEKRQSGGSET